MINAPKTIWVDPGLAEDLEQKSEFIEEVQYIRADMVEELREALLGMIGVYKGEFGSHWGEQCAEETEEHKDFLSSYYSGDWFSARVIAEHLAERESPLQHYYESMLDRIKAGLPKNWDGTFRATSK